MSSQSTCPSNWTEFNNRCYYFETIRGYTWNESRESCEQLNSVLVSIHSDEENKFVFNNNGASTWFGYFRPYPGGPFEWLDGSDKDFSNWADGEPNDEGGMESCGEFNPNLAPFSWNDAVCTDSNGYVCVSDINPCWSDPCENNATCVDEAGNYTCICADGYEGQNCEIDINYCLLDPCDNDATCVDAVNDYTCTCADGFTGRNCETDINDCLSDPCDNDATCVDAVNDYICTCSDGFTGRNCETDINDCLQNPCENSATCVDAINSYICICLDGFTGRHCETDKDDCVQKPCDNNAKCVDAVNSYTCICLDGFTGRDCEIDINECSVNNGGCAEICVNEIGGYQCMCANGVRQNSDGKRVCVEQTAVTIDICLDADWDVVLEDFSQMTTLELAASIESEVFRVGSTIKDIDDLTIKIIDFFPCGIGFRLVIEANNGLGQVDVAEIASGITKAMSQPGFTLSIQLSDETVDVSVNVPPETYFVDSGTNLIDKVVTQEPCTYLDATGYCRNGGQCYNANGGPICSCIGGYTGPDCTDIGNIVAIVVATLFGLALLMLVIIVVCIHMSRRGQTIKRRNLNNNRIHQRGFVPYSTPDKIRYWRPAQRW